MIKKSKIVRVRGVTDGAFKILVDKVTELAKTVEDDRKELLDKINALSESPTLKIVVPQVEPNPSPKEGEDKEWRDIIDELLGKDFGMEVERSTAGYFRFSIIVPAEKSNTPKDLLIKGVDKRTKTIENRMGSVGVEAFCRLVAQNLKI
jgi:hypothetical protein